MANKKRIHIDITSQQLDALEDLLTAELSEVERRKATANVLRLWKIMVLAFDSSESKKSVDVELSKANKTIQKLKAQVQKLEDEEIAFPFRLYYALEAILDHDPVYQLVPPTEINLYDLQFETTRKIKLLPKDILCILSEESGRKKTIYTLEENLDGKRELCRYSFNKAGDLETWARFFDKLAHRLIKVSKSAIANVAFYQLANDHCLHLRRKLPRLPQIELIKISDKKSVYDTFKADFLKVQGAYRNHILLQKKVLGYMNLIDAIVEGKFTP